MNMLDKPFQEVNRAVNTVVDGTPNDLHSAFLELSPIISGKKIWTGVGKIDYDWDSGLFVFQRNGDISKQNDRIVLEFTKTSSVKEDGNAGLIVKWIQHDERSPIFTLQWKIKRQGQEPSDWSAPISIQSSAGNERWERRAGDLVQTTVLFTLDLSGTDTGSTINFMITRSDSEADDIFVDGFGLVVPIDQPAGGRGEWEK